MTTRVYSRLHIIPGWLLPSFFNPFAAHRQFQCSGHVAMANMLPLDSHKKYSTGKGLNFSTTGTNPLPFVVRVSDHHLCTGLVTSLNLCTKGSQNSNAPSPQSSSTCFPKGMPLASSPVQQPLAASHPRAPRESHYEHAAIGSASGCSPPDGWTTWTGVGNGYWNLTLSNRWFFQVLQLCCLACLLRLWFETCKAEKWRNRRSRAETQAGEPRVFGHKRDVPMSHSGNTLHEGARQVHLLGVIL